MTKKPKVGVSQCLLGDAVRYDGQANPNTIVIEKLGKHFDLVPVCPEVEAGLGIPRPPVQLTTSVTSPRLTGRDDASIDVTETMHKFCAHKMSSLSSLHGFILKSRSPSCGLNSTPVFIDEQLVTENGRGIFAKYLCETFLILPVIEDTNLENPEQYEIFISAIKLYAKKHPR